MKKITLLVTAIILSVTQLSVMADTAPTTCKTDIKNASYTGPYKGAENNLTLDDFFRDLSCAESFRAKKYPNGFVTIFGSSRINEKGKSTDPEVNEQNARLYKQIYNLASNWTKKHADTYPILTGAGPGVMEAGARGATDAGGPSIGYTTYYGPSRNGTNGDASKAFWQYRPSAKKSQTIISDGLIFTSVAIRESLMINHSAAMVFAPGGTGTEWELFQTIEQIKSNQLDPLPMYIVGDKHFHWQSFYDRLDDMIKRGTIKRYEVEELFTHVDNPEDVVKLLERDLKLKKF